MKTRISKTGTKGKAAEQATRDQKRLISDARDAEAAARMARVMMGFVSGELIHKDAMLKVCSQFELQAEALEEAAGKIIRMLTTGKVSTSHGISANGK